MNIPTVSVQCDALPDRVFQVASDFHNAAERISAITKCEVLTEGPIGVGTRFRETRVMFKRECTEEMEITAYDPPHSYVLGAESCGCRYRTELRFTPKNGGTEVTFDFQAQPLTLFAKIMSILMRPMLKKALEQCHKDLLDLKATVESPETAQA